MEYRECLSKNFGFIDWYELDPDVVRVSRKHLSKIEQLTKNKHQTPNNSNDNNYNNDNSDTAKQPSTTPRRRRQGEQAGTRQYTEQTVTGAIHCRDTSRLTRQLTGTEEQQTQTS